MQPKISIIVPTYKVEKYLRDALDSILNQTYSNWEAICVNDGSPDGGGRILEEYARGDVRIKVVHQRNAGLSQARNRALSIASGAYIAFLDGDDVIDCRWVETITRIVNSNDVDICFFKFCYTDENMTTLPRQVWEHLPPKRWKADTRKWSMYRFWSHPLCSCTGVCNAVFKRGTIQGMRFSPQLKTAEDIDFCWDVIVKAKKVIDFDYPGYYYRQRSSSMMHVPHYRDSVCAQISRIKKVLSYAKGEAIEDICPLWGYATYHWRMLLIRLRLRKTLGESGDEYLRAWLFDGQTQIMRYWVRKVFLYGLLLLLHMLLFVMKVFRVK